MESEEILILSVCHFQFLSSQSSMLITIANSFSFLLMYALVIMFSRQAIPWVNMHSMDTWDYIIISECILEQRNKRIRILYFVGICILIIDVASWLVYFMKYVSIKYEVRSLNLCNGILDWTKAEVFVKCVSLITDSRPRGMGGPTTVQYNCTVVLVLNSKIINTF